MQKKLIVQTRKEVLDAILEGAKRLYPRENILLLRGKRTKEVLEVSDLIIPPLANRGSGFSGFPFHMLPMDFSLVGTAHSHPSGELRPSHTDLNHFFGIILMIVGFPYSTENVAVYDRAGDLMELQLKEE